MSTMIFDYISGVDSKILMELFSSLNDGLGSNHPSNRIGDFYKEKLTQKKKYEKLRIHRNCSKKNLPKLLSCYATGLFYQFKNSSSLKSIYQNL